MGIEPTGDFVSVAEAALRAKYADGTIRRWIKLGWIGAYGHGKGTRVRMSEVLAPRRTPPDRNWLRDSRMRFHSQKRKAAAAPETLTQPIVEAAPQTTPIDDWYARAAKRDK